MGMVQLPAARLGGHRAKRHVLPQGVASGPAHLRVLERLPAVSAMPAYCESCARPIDFGAVFRGAQLYCSVECSLGSLRPPAG
jgi:hypothetical protein